MLIEFAGLPGSGKSECAQRLLVALRASGYPAEDGRALRRTTTGGRVRRGARKFALIWRYHRLWAVAVAVLLASNRPGRDRILTTRRLAAALDSHTLALRSPGIVVLDEGVVQRAFSVFVDGRSASEKRLNRYVSGAPTPSLLVVLRIEPELAVQRLKDRPRGLSPRLARHGPETQIDFLSAAANMFAQVGNGLCQRDPNMELVMVDAGHPLESIAAELLAIVRKLAGSRQTET